MSCRMPSVRMPATDESFHAMPTATSERSSARQRTGQERGHLCGTPRTVVIGASVLGSLRPCLRPDGGPYPWVQITQIGAHCLADHRYAATRADRRIFCAPSLRLVTFCGRKEHGYGVGTGRGVPASVTRRAHSQRGTRKMAGPVVPSRGELLPVATVCVRGRSESGAGTARDGTGGVQLRGTGLTELEGRALRDGPASSAQSAPR